jgi:hypothetical protein
MIDDLEAPTETTSSPTSDLEKLVFKHGIDSIQKQLVELKSKFS